MCGIAGVFHRDTARPVETATLAAMAAIQRHRGPDGCGWHAIDGRGVGFAHARLAIIDLADTGRQPLVAPDERWLLTHNGEFYDYARIRADLATRGYRFRSKSDSEIVPHLAERHGLDGALPHLRGEFAFGFYDREHDELALVRDRFGIKPLYWCETAAGIVFGSEVKVLFAHPEVERAFDDAGLYHQLMQTIVPGSTPYAGVHQVRPGHVVRFRRRDGRITIDDRPYWDMPFPRRADRDPDPSESAAVEGVRAQLLEAVQLRLVADVPVGCYLSGGIDSCSMLGLAAACRQDPVKAFTIGFDDAEYDETAIAREMAAAVGADQDVLPLAADDLYDHFVETHWHTERTIYNTLGVAKMLMSRHVRRAGYKVVITGEGSDELFAGYPSFRADLFRHGLDDLPAGEREAMQRALADSNRVFQGAMLPGAAYDDPALTALCGFTPTCLQPWLDASRRVLPLLAPDRRRDLADYSPGAAIAAALDSDAIRGRHPLDIAQYVWIKTMLEGQILTWGGDRVDMANSMEARPAFLDHRLAEYAARISPHLRIKARTEKYVLREAMKGVLPRVLYEREKFAFMAPPAHTDPKKRRALDALAARYLSPAQIGAAGLLDATGVQALLAAYAAEDVARAELVQLDAIINHALGVQILHDALIARDVPAHAAELAQPHLAASQPTGCS
ncbi:MAG: asparagine synthase (glutamine-hydrolyzing) [Planctomycetes bacterium]|nr:asparagine synthase (glutamine-hydrolyzing) [Planctomycetota bacterium]